MAVIKAVSSHSDIGQALDYVMQEEKTEEKLLSGKDCQVETVREEMQITKKLWGKTDGRTYKHFVQSFHQDEDITPEQAHSIAKEFAEKCRQFRGFEVLIATHKDRKHIHTHFVLNSVSHEDGHKFRMHKSELQEMKDLSDQICSQRGLHICEKGKNFEGAEREETSADNKEVYQYLKKAERGEVKSYVQDIALAVMDCRETATSREDFIDQMKARGYGVDWQDSHKYITFTDLERKEQGEKKCKVRNNKLEKYYAVDFGKEKLLNGFEINARRKAERTATTERARQQLDRTAVAEDSGAGKKYHPDNTAERLANLRSYQPSRRMEEPSREIRDTDTEALIRETRTVISNTRRKEENSGAERANREAERSRQGIAEQRGSEEAKREVETRKARRSERSRYKGWER